VRSTEVRDRTLTSDTVGNNLFLGFWTAESIHGLTQGEYMAIYASLGFAQALFSYLSSFTFRSVLPILHTSCHSRLAVSSRFTPASDCSRLRSRVCSSRPRASSTRHQWAESSPG
jgi:hypothetical protein